MAINLLVCQSGLQARNDAIKTVGQLIHDENQKMEEMRKTEPDKVDDQLSYMLVSMIENR